MKFQRFLALVLLAVLSGSASFVKAQQVTQHRLHIDRGFVIPHHEDMYHLYRTTTAVQYEYSRPIEASKHHIGFTLYAAQLGSQVVGNAYSGSFQMHRDLITSKHVGLQFGLAFGLGWISNPYDINRNPTNRAIGSHGNAFGQAYLGTTIRLSESVAISSSLRFSHFSNGAWSAPNLGVNIPSISVGLVKVIPTSTLIASRELEERLWIPFTAFRTGRKGLDIDDRRHFWIPVLELGASRRISKNSVLRLSAALHGDPYYRFEKFEPLAPFTLADGVDAGIAVGYQKWFGRWGMLFDLGWYIYKPNRGYKTPYFEALGLSYRFDKDWECMLRLKANKTTADLIEFGLTYHW